MATYQKIESIARRISLNSVMDSDKDRLELYGYYTPVLNIKKVEAELARGYYSEETPYYPSLAEREIGIGILKARFEAYCERNR